MLHIKNVEEIKAEWEQLIKRLSLQFDADLDFQGILFLIGVQELGKGPDKYSKSQKQDLMHIATCRLLSSYGYYVLEGEDDDGWPHWKKTQTLPRMTLGEQDYLLKQAVIDYFTEVT